jgi:glycosyltransferase involved in cell wall biosynthesis
LAFATAAAPSVDGLHSSERIVSDADLAVDVSIVIPTYREFSFEDALERLIGHLKTAAVGDTEILVVDDSDDLERAKLGEVLEKHEEDLVGCTVRLVPGPRRGKGAAVREGVLNARGSIIFTMDADLPVNLRHLGEFADILRSSGAGLVMAERPKDRNRNDLGRRVLSQGLYWLQRVVVFRKHVFDDTQCGFKAFRADLVKALAERQVIEGGMVDLEYLYAATLRGESIVRIAVDVNDEVRPSRINVWRCLRVDPLDIARVVVRGLLGHYR